MNFESFLQKKYGRMGQFKGPDNDQDAFDGWLQQLDPQEWLDYGQEWGDELSKEVRAVVEDECRHNA